MEARKQAICDALRAFIEQRPGFEFANYGDVAAYRSDQRTAQLQLHDARTLLRQVELSDGITADAMLAACGGGRVQILEGSQHPSSDTTRHGGAFRIDYTTGQYWCTEYRGAVARYLSSLLWDWKREHCMPPSGTAPIGSGKAQAGMYWEGETRQVLSASDWLRASFRREFGKGLAARYFN